VAQQISLVMWNSLKAEGSSQVVFQTNTGSAQAIGDGLAVVGTPIVSFTKTTSYGDTDGDSWPLLDDVCQLFREEGTCKGGSECQDVDSKPTCICPAGRTGETCEETEPLTLFGQSLEGINGSLLLSLLFAAALLLGLFGLFACCAFMCMKGGGSRVIYVDEEKPYFEPPDENYIEYIDEAPPEEPVQAYDVARYEEYPRTGFTGVRINLGDPVINSRLAGRPW